MSKQKNHSKSSVIYVDVTQKEISEGYYPGQLDRMYEPFKTGLLKEDVDWRINVIIRHALFDDRPLHEIKEIRAWYFGLLTQSPELLSRMTDECQRVALECTAHLQLHKEGEFVGFFPSLAWIDAYLYCPDRVTPPAYMQSYFSDLLTILFQGQEDWDDLLKALGIDPTPVKL